MKVKVFKLKKIKLVTTGEIINCPIEPILPTYGKERDACMDIYPIHCEKDINKDRFIYHTGLSFNIGESLIYDADYINIDVPNEMELRPRSNITKSDFYMPNSPGTLDYGYRGELLIIFKNRTSKELVNCISLINTAIKLLNKYNVLLDKSSNKTIETITNTITSNLAIINTNISNLPYKCDGIDRCAQLIIRGSNRIEWKEVNSIEELGESERGNGGFGSTGGGVKD